MPFQRRKLSVFALCLAAILGTAGAQAQQTRQLIKPGDSTRVTAHAGPAFVMPVMPTAAETQTILHQGIQDMVPAMIAAGSGNDKPWVAYFLGQTRCASMPTPMLVGQLYTGCATINIDGSIKTWDNVGNYSTVTIQGVGASSWPANGTAIPGLATLLTSFIGPGGNAFGAISRDYSDGSCGGRTGASTVTARPLLTDAQVVSGAIPTDWGISLSFSFLQALDFAATLSKSEDFSRERAVLAALLHLA